MVVTGWLLPLPTRSAYITLHKCKYTHTDVYTNTNTHIQIHKYKCGDRLPLPPCWHQTPTIHPHSETCNLYHLLTSPLETLLLQLCTVYNVRFRQPLDSGACADISAGCVTWCGLTQRDIGPLVTHPPNSSTIMWSPHSQQFLQRRGLPVIPVNLWIFFSLVSKKTFGDKRRSKRNQVRRRTRRALLLFPFLASLSLLSAWKILQINHIFTKSSSLPS